MPLDILATHLRGSAAFTFPHMELLARDHEPPIVVGEGEFRIVSETEFAYDIRGLPPDPGHSLRALNRLREDSYDGLNRFRLQMRDVDGRHWSGGWTIPDFEIGNPSWRFSGTCDQFGSDDQREPHEGPATPPTELRDAAVAAATASNGAQRR